MTISNKETILELIKFDREIRNSKKYEDDIFTLDKLEKNCEWDYTLPTLVKNENIFNKSKINNLNLDSFKERFFKKYPFLDFFRWDNIYVAGGCIGGFILGNSNYYSTDIDIFIYAHTDEKASSVVNRVVREIVGFKKRKYVIDHRNNSNNLTYESVDESMLNINFTRNKYTLNVDDYQIIFRRYESKSEIIHGFDIGSSAVGFDGKDIHFTSLSKFAYECGYNVIDTMRRSTSYEHRLLKYFDRGFDIIMPELDITKLDTHLFQMYKLANVCELPFMCFTFTECTRNKIVFSRFYKKVNENQNISDYDHSDGNDNEYEIFYKNLYKVLIGKTDEMLYVSHSSDEILNPKLSIISHKIDYFYDNLYQKIISGDKFPTSMVAKYLKCTDTNYIFENRDNKENVLTEIENQKLVILSKLKNTIISKDIQWMSADPGTQLTSSFNPIIEDASEWYGAYFTKLF